MAWMNNYIHVKQWDVIIHRCPHSNRFEVRVWMSHYITRDTMGMITYPCPDLSQTLLVHMQMGPLVYFGGENAICAVMMTSSNGNIFRVTGPLCGEFTGCRLPSQVKIANVLPLFKAEDPLHFKNYRPVSSLCIVSKVFEKIMFSRLHEFLEKWTSYMNISLDSGRNNLHI